MHPLLPHRELVRGFKRNTKETVAQGRRIDQRYFKVERVVNAVSQFRSGEREAGGWQ
ncbi:MAG: hypothetical protein KY450_01345 [Actinobacteria bacterium]|nr:hypothetical protein [Actinomycetota bacterium]